VQYCTIVLCYGAEVYMGNDHIWKIQLQFYKFILQVLTRAPNAAVMAELYWMIPSTTTHPTKSNQVFCLPQLPNIPHYLAEEYIRVTNNILPWMRDLHSADLQIATTEPITSHNECLQVVKSSANSQTPNGMVWIYYGKTAIHQGIQESWDSTNC